MFVTMIKKDIHSARYVNDNLKFPKIFVLLMHVMYRKQHASKEKNRFFFLIKNKN